MMSQTRDVRNRIREVKDSGSRGESGEQVRGCAVAAGGVHGRGFPANGKGRKKRSRSEGTPGRPGKIPMNTVYLDK